MLQLFAPLLAVSALFAHADQPQSPGSSSLVAGTRLTYSGRLVPAERDDDKPPNRTFRVTYLVGEITQLGGYRVAWLLDDVSGSPRSGWWQRFGMLPLSKSLTITSDREVPHIGGEQDGMVRRVRLPAPFFAAPEPLKAESKWMDNDLRFEVVGREKIADAICWKVAVSSGLGLRRMFWVDSDSPLVAKHHEVVFLGQGVPHELTLELSKFEKIPAEEVVRNLKAHEGLVTLRGPVKDQSGDDAGRGQAATPELLQQAQTTLAAIEGAPAGRPYVDLAKEAVRETQAVIERQNALAKLAAKAVGKTAKDFSLTTTNGSKVSLASLKGKPVVLHFWEYHSEPKVAPYGETGYLDFLWRQRQKQGIQVVGVAVDDRLRDPATRAAARKDIRSFCEFMNLSYTIAYDDEKLVDNFGDPRQVGGKLPLYVVIAPNGEVTQYHPGVWASTPDEGLKELDQSLQKLKL